MNRNSLHVWMIIFNMYVRKADGVLMIVSLFLFMFGGGGYIHQ